MKKNCEGFSKDCSAFWTFAPITLLPPAVTFSRMRYFFISESVIFVGLIDERYFTIFSICFAFDDANVSKIF